jgi:L-rhamnose isomerase
MSKRKPIYFVKIYRRAKNKNVALDCEFGAFSSPEKAIRWLVSNKETAIKEFACGHVQKNLFFVIMKHQVDSPGNEWCGIAVAAVDLNGVKTDFFKK